MSEHELPNTQSLDEEEMTTIKGVTNLIGPLMIVSFVVYGGSLIVHYDGVTTIPQLIKKVFLMFGLG